VGSTRSKNPAGHAGNTHLTEVRIRSNSYGLKQAQIIANLLGNRTFKEVQWDVIQTSVVISNDQVVCKTAAGHSDIGHLFNEVLRVLSVHGGDWSIGQGVIM